MTTATANKPARNASRKGAGKGKGKTAEAPVIETTEETAPAPVKTFAERLIDALVTRNSAAPSKDNDISVSAARKGQTALNALYQKGEWAEVCDKLVSAFAVTDKKDTRFIAVKAGVKIIHALYAISTGIRSEFDPYTRVILANVASLNELRNKSALVALSKSITYDETEQTQALVSKYNCSPGTASTQASSTRMMLRALNVCEVHKGKQGDVMRTLDNERCTQVLAMFAGK